MFYARSRPPQRTYRVDWLGTCGARTDTSICDSSRFQPHLAELSLSNTKKNIEKLGVERSRTAIHDLGRKADLQPDSDVNPDQIAVDETLVRVNGQRHWLFAAAVPDSNQYLHFRLFQTRTAQLTVLFQTRTPRETAAVERDVSRR